MARANIFKNRLVLAFIALPALLLLLAITGIWLLDGFACILYLIALAVIWLSVTYVIILRFAGNFRYHADKINQLAGDQATAGVKQPKHSFSELNETLINISKHISRQEEELQHEKLRRLRSVIDGQDKERNRLARELHDGLGQSLIAIKLQLENAGNQNYSIMRAGIDTAKNMLDSTIEEVRRVCNALLPAALNEFGIVSTLRARCDEMANLAGFRMNFETEGSFERIDRKSKIYLYRIAQEALNNIAKHARAGEVWLSLRRNDNFITLLIRDNGKGFTFDPVNFAHRNGLQNMRERTLLLHGQFDVETAPGEGTTLKVIIPYKIENGKDQDYPG